jgi:hypothetical protein
MSQKMRFLPSIPHMHMAVRLRIISLIFKVLIAYRGNGR